MTEGIVLCLSVLDTGDRAAVRRRCESRTREHLSGVHNQSERNDTNLAKCVPTSTREDRSQSTLNLIVRAPFRAAQGRRVLLSQPLCVAISLCCLSRSAAGFRGRRKEQDNSQVTAQSHTPPRHSMSHPPSETRTPRRRTHHRLRLRGHRCGQHGVGGGNIGNGRTLQAQAQNDSEICLERVRCLYNRLQLPMVRSRSQMTPLSRLRSSSSPSVLSLSPLASPSLPHC